MKFAGLGVFSAARNSGSLGEAVVRKWEHRLAVFMSEQSVNPKWSPPLGGLKLQVPELPASSANACQVNPADSSLSTMLGEEIMKQQLPSLVYPKVLPPMRAR